MFGRALKFVVGWLRWLSLRLLGWVSPSSWSGFSVKAFLNASNTWARSWESSSVGFLRSYLGTGASGVMNMGAWWVKYLAVAVLLGAAFTAGVVWEAERVQDKLMAAKNQEIAALTRSMVEMRDASIQDAQARADREVARSAELETILEEGKKDVTDNPACDLPDGAVRSLNRAGAPAVIKPSPKRLRFKRSN